MQHNDGHHTAKVEQGTAPKFAMVVAYGQSFLHTSVGSDRRGQCVVLGQGCRWVDWAWPGVASGNACSRETLNKLVNGHDYST